MTCLDTVGAWNWWEEKHAIVLEFFRLPGIVF